jgi:hypothetical protein
VPHIYRYNSNMNTHCISVIVVPLHSCKLPATIHYAPLLRKVYPNSSDKTLHCVQVNDVKSACAFVVVNVEAIRVFVADVTRANHCKNDDLGPS